MPRYRKLNTSTIDSLDLDAMPDDFHRLTWIILPLILCREGRGMYYPTWLRSKLYPLRSDVTDSDISETFAWYKRRGMIVTYEVDCRQYFYIPTWHKYQGVTIKESESPYPPQPDLFDSKSKPGQELVKSNSGVSQELVKSNSGEGLHRMNTESEYCILNNESSNEPFRNLFDAFLDATGISETMLNLQKSSEEITKKWIPGGVTPQDVRDAVKSLLGKGYNIVGPWSITNALSIVRSKNKQSDDSNKKIVTKKVKVDFGNDIRQDVEDREILTNE